jgi:hypothetical protein
MRFASPWLWQTSRVRTIRSMSLTAVRRVRVLTVTLDAARGTVHRSVANAMALYRRMETLGGLDASGHSKHNRQISKATGDQVVRNPSSAGINFGGRSTYQIAV